MTAIEFLIIIFVVLGAILGSSYGSRFGSGGQVACIILGSILGLLCNLVLLTTVVWIGSVLEWWRPDRPKCKKGKCYSDHYDYLSFSSHKLTEREEQLQTHYQALVLRCRCGTKYIRPKKLRKFMEILPDGSVRAYMCYASFSRHWRSDPASEIGEP